MTLAVTSKTYPLSQVEDFTDTRLAQKISQVTGVGLVTISGGQKPAVRVQANPDRSFRPMASAWKASAPSLQSASVNLAKGNFDGTRQAYEINANDQLLSSKDYQSLVVAYRNGAPVVLSDVAKVIDDVENTKLAAWANSTPAVIVNIQRQPGANIIQVVDRVKQLLPQLKANLPASMDVSILTDRTTTIRASVRDVKFSLMLTIALVVLAIFLFLRNVYATIIPSVAVPLSLVGTLGVMYLLGYSLNNLTLMALTISTGFVVDDAIVMIENVFRYIEQGEKPLQAALKGAEQIGFTIISLTISLIAGLIPLLFMGDIVGRLFREFAVTLSVTILVSACVSLTLTPMMCSRLLKSKADEKKHGRFFEATERVYDRIIKFYGRTLQTILKHQTATLFVAVGDAGVHDFALRHRAERIFPRAGHRRDSGHFRRRAKHFFHRDGRTAAGARAGDFERSGSGKFVVIHRRGRHQRDAQQRTHSHQPQAARRTKNQRERCHSPLAAGIGEGRGHHAEHAAGAGFDGGRSREPHAISIHARRRQRG